jgi:phosphoglycerate kinase
MRYINEADLFDKRVLVRVDFNVPVDAKGDIQEDSRIKAALPTIQYILEQRPHQLILMSHMGEPEGKVVENLKMDKVAERLTQLLEKTVYKTKDCILKKMPGEGLILLENLRFHKEETDNDEEFAKKLASYADVYINDAFGACHRKHASLHAIVKFVPSYIGFLIEKELEHLDLEAMPKPVVAILGGAKLKTKIPLIQRMLLKCDHVIVGGGMIFTFYKAKKLEIGKSMLDTDYLKDAELMMHNDKIYIPEDVVVANPKTYLDIEDVDVDKIPAEKAGLDIGQKSIAKIKEILSGAKTIIWNGPLGYYERAPFDASTRQVAQIIAGMECNKIAGGGDTADALHSYGLDDKFTFISSGGGASLELLSGNKLVALQALEELGHGQGDKK